MKTLIFSDSHLTNRFYKNKFNFLYNLFSQYDRIIINGDFWDGYLTNFNSFYNCWKELFPLLKSKDTIYLFGNHDDQKFSDKRIYDFCNIAADFYEIKVGDKTLHIEHGHKISPSPELRYGPRWMIGNIFVTSIHHLRNRFWVKILGTKYYKNGRDNLRMKKWAETNLESGKILVCGHSHDPEMNLEKNFINSGSLDFGYANYISISDDQIELIAKRY